MYCEIDSMLAKTQLLHVRWKFENTVLRISDASHLKIPCHCQSHSLINFLSRKDSSQILHYLQSQTVTSFCAFLELNDHWHQLFLFCLSTTVLRYYIDQTFLATFRSDLDLLQAYNNWDTDQNARSYLGRTYLLHPIIKWSCRCFSQLKITKTNRRVSLGEIDWIKFSISESKALPLSDGILPILWYICPLTGIRRIASTTLLGMGLAQD